MHGDSIAAGSNPAKPARHMMWLLNLIGALTYLVLASRSWAIPSEHGQVPITGEPFVWALALPVFGVFSIVNLAWGAMILTRRQWDAARFWLLTALIWLAAVWIDFAHH